MKFISWISSLKVWVWIASAIGVLIGIIKYQSYRNESLKNEAKEVEDAIAQSEYNHTVNVKNAINEEAYRKAKEKLDEVVKHDLTKPYDT